DSRSMQVRDIWPGGAPEDPTTDAPVGQGTARLEAVRRALNRHAGALEALQADVDLHWFAVDGDIRALPVGDNGETAGPHLKGEGDQTGLAMGLERMRELLGQTGVRPAGVMVISDGRDNLSTDDERRFAGEWLAVEGIPLYTVGVGSETSLSD